MNTELTHEQHISGSYSATSALLGSGILLFKHHTISVQGLVSQVKYNLLPGRDTAVLGYSYKVDYSINYKKFDLRLSALNSANNYIQNAGQQQIYIDSKYIVSDKVRISLYGNRQYYATSHYPYNFFISTAYNSTDYLRLTTSISNGNISYQIGPSYSGSMRQNFNPITQYNSEYLTYQPGLWGSASIRINNYGSLSPNFSVSNLRFYYNTKDPASQSYSSLKNIYYSVGINYYDNIWRANISYVSGSSSDMYRSIQIESDPITSKSIQFRPSYENFFFDRKLKLSASINYAYYMPSGRENVSYNIKTDLLLKKGWTAYVSGFVFSNTRVNDEQGRISSKDLNFVVGVTKSFNIQQPRLKYYNLKSVFFNDLDGNGMKSENEPPVSNILVNIAKDQTVKSGVSNVQEAELLSDVNGEIRYENLPKDSYRLKLLPLVNLQNLYFINGSDQPYYNDKDRVQYIPLSESYRIKGKINLIRDQNSLEGKIDLKGIRVTATGEKGESFSALTDNFGGYLLTVATANKYKIHVNNVFGELFNIDTDEMEVQFAQSKAINLDFSFFEKRRDIQFENGKEIFKFKSISGQSESPEYANNSVQPQKSTAANKTTTIPISYAIQLGVSKTYRDPSFFQKATKLTGEVFFMEKNGEFKYFTGTFSSIAAAKKVIVKLGAKGLFAVAVDRSLLKKAESIVPAVIPSTYSVQLDILKSYREPSFYKDKFKLTEDVMYIEKNGEFKYYVGNYKTIEEAKTDITKFGLSGFPVIVDRALLMKAHIPQNAKIYSIQLEMLKEYREPTFYKDKYKLTEDVLYTEKPGEFKYYFGSYKTAESAKADIAKLGLTGFPVSIDKLTLKKAVVKDSTTIYSIQLDVLKTYCDPSFYKDKFKLNDEVLFLEKEGEFKYYFGSYKTVDDAKVDISKFGITGFPVSVDRTSLKKAVAAISTTTYSIQLDLLKKFRDPSFYKAKFKLNDEVLFLEKDGEFKYYFGSYKTAEDAKVDIAKLGLTGFPVAVDKALLQKAVVTESTTSFSIQLDVQKVYRDPSFYKDKFKLADEVLILEEKGKFKYYSGNYKSKDEAKANKVKLGLTGSPVEVDRKLLKKASEIIDSHKMNPEAKVLSEKVLQGV